MLTLFAYVCDNVCDHYIWFSQWLIVFFYLVWPFTFLQILFKLIFSFSSEHSFPRASTSSMCDAPFWSTSQNCMPLMLLSALITLLFLCVLFVVAYSSHLWPASSTMLYVDRCVLMCSIGIRRVSIFKLLYSTLFFSVIYWITTLGAQRICVYLLKRF